MIYYWDKANATEGRENAPLGTAPHVAATSGVDAPSVGKDRDGGFDKLSAT